MRKFDPVAPIHSPSIQTLLESWRPVFEWVVLEKGSLPADIGQHFSLESNSSENNAMSGAGLTDFPHYAVLCEPLPPGAPGNRFILLTAQMLTAHAVAMREHSTLDDYRIDGKENGWHFLPNRTSTSGLAIRRMAESEYNHLLFKLSLKLPPEEFALELPEIEPFDNPRVEKDKQDLSRFLQKAWGLLDWRVLNSGSGGGGLDGGHKWIGRRLEGPKLSMEQSPFGRDDVDCNEWRTDIS